MTLFARLRRKLGALAMRRGNPTAAPPAPVDPSAIDLDAPEIARDPFPHYDALRAAGRVQFLEHHGAWIVLGHDEVQWAFNHPDLLSNRPYEDVDAVLLGSDPPEHTAVRRMLNPYFARDVIERLGVFAAEQAASLLRGRIDVVAGYGRPVSESVAARLIGFEHTEVEALRDAAAHAAGFGDYMRNIDLLAHRAAMYGRLRGDGFDEPRARSLVRLFWVASTATTERVIAQCVLALLQHPGTRAAIESNPSLLAPFIEEVMRLHQPEPMLRRLATSDFDLGDAHITAGSLVYLSLAAANRDPRRYERPNELRLDRGPSHLTFGHGIHRCIGATLGRVTIAAAMRTLLAEAPAFRAAQPLESVPHRATMMAHYIENLTIETQ